MSKFKCFCEESPKEKEAEERVKRDENGRGSEGGRRGRDPEPRSETSFSDGCSGHRHKVAVERALRPKREDRNGANNIYI